MKQTPSIFRLDTVNIYIRHISTIEHQRVAKIIVIILIIIID